MAVLHSKFSSELTVEQCYYSVLSRNDAAGGEISFVCSAVCCSVLQHVAACCSGLQSVYTYPIFTTRVLQCEQTLLEAKSHGLQCSVWQCVAVCCRVCIRSLLLVCVAVRKDAMTLLETKSHWCAVQCVAACCSVLQCVAVCEKHISDLYYSCVEA